MIVVIGSPFGLLSFSLQDVEKAKADKDRHRRSKKKYKEQVFRAASGEEEQEIIPRRYAEERRQVRKIVIGGKCYQDITDWFM